jgi:diacylglycerol kinase
MSLTSARLRRPAVHFARSVGLRRCVTDGRRTILSTTPWRARPLLALTRPWISPRLALSIEVVVVGAVLALAALVRADDFMVVPRLTDETLEVVLGLRLAREGGLPLVGYAPHIGGLFTYLTAGMFLLLGPKIEAGRLLVLTTGVLTVLPTYLLGRDLGQLLVARGEGRGARDNTRRAEAERLTRGRIVGLIAALLLALSAPHVATSSRIAYSNSLTPLFIMTGLWLANRAIGRRSDRALIGSGVAFGLALQSHVSAVTVLPGVAAAILLPLLASWKRGELARVTPGGQACPERQRRDGRAPEAESVWPRLDALVTAAGAGLLMVVNLLVYNLISGPATAATAGNRIGRYVGESSWTFAGWGERLAGLLQAAALAVGGYTSEVEASASALLSPVIVVSVALALLGLWVSARRGAWLPLLVTVSILISVSLFNGRVEPIVPRVRHYATLVPLGAVMIALALVWLHDRVAAWQRADGPDVWSSRRSAGNGGGAWLARAGLVLVPLLLAGGSLASYGAYEAERLSRPDKNNAAYLAILESVAASGNVDERLYLDDELGELLTMSGGRMLSHLRYAFEVRGQELDTIEVAEERLPIGQRGTNSRRLVLTAGMVETAARRYRLVPLPGEPGEGAPIRAFRAFPLHE